MNSNLEKGGRIKLYLTIQEISQTNPESDTPGKIPLPFCQHQRRRRHWRAQRVQDANRHHAVRQTQGGYAALAAGVGRVFGKRGVFYEITGPQVAGLDGFYSTYFEDYKNFGILSPKEPDKAAAKVEAETGIHCCIADINDFGGDVLAISPQSPMDKPLLQKLLKDNPAGNGHEMTPFVLLREKKD